jgi:N-acetylglucosamine kinase-like BadF-type ATPase
LRAAIQQITHSVEKALMQARIPLDCIHAAAFCLAGADFPQDYQALKEGINQVLPIKRILVKNDVMAALKSGLTRPYGIVVVSGTGINAGGISREGREYVMLGLGRISGDWGGGADISCEMIRVIVRAWDGRGDRTVLAPMVLDALKVQSVPDLITKLYHKEINFQSVLSIVPLLFEAAERGDAVARSIISAVGEEVAITAKAVICKLDLQDSACEVVLAGSIFKGEGRLLVETITHGIQQEFPAMKIKRPAFEPVVGSLWLAMEEMGIQRTKTILHNMERTVPDELVRNQRS